MLTLQVYIHVKPEYVEAFQAATIENVRHSLQEPGIAAFYLLQQADDPTRFELVEVYRTPDDPARHKQTPHYNKWAETVTPMLAESRTRTQYISVYPTFEEPRQ
ncbi:MAG: antibiotic biosynthesis monooxygenase [Chloroflexota bacterium]